MNENTVVEAETAFDLDFDVIADSVLHCGTATSSTLTMEFFVTIGEENWAD